MVAPTESKLTSSWNTARHGSGGWPKFLDSVTISGLRGWQGQVVDFRYPVVAIAGVNGAGKSTVLKAAAAAYRAPANGVAITYDADDFFPSTPWEDVSGVVLGYSVHQSENVQTYSVRKPTKRWRGGPQRPIRSSFFLDISRIQPANTQIGYGRTAQDVISRGTTQGLSNDRLNQLGYILGRNYEAAEFARAESKQVGVVTRNGVRYSNFHQGAGEDSVLDLIGLVGDASNYSLILIDEVEASLHPQAQRGLMTELLRLAEDKKLQIIMTTHSSYILDQLPSVARIFVSVDRDSVRKVMYGITSQFALNLMDDEMHCDVDVYCEDSEAAYVIERIVAKGAPDILNRIRVVPAGPANTVRALGEVAAKGKFPIPTLCVVDADQPVSPVAIKLPGSHPPEIEIFSALDDSSWSDVARKLGKQPGEVLDAKEQAMRIPNHHAWVREMARLLGGMTRPSRVWEHSVDVWVEAVLGDNAARDWCSSLVRMCEESES